jgi:hypothetical protein
MRRIMGKRIVTSAVVLAAWAARVPGLWADCKSDAVAKPELMVDGRGWIVGTWRSYELDYGDFGEWKGTARIELVASSPRKIGLWLIAPDGKRTRAGDSEPSIMDDKRLFFGPCGSGLLFRYQRSGDVLTLDLNASGARIHAKLRRVFSGR